MIVSACAAVIPDLLVRGWLNNGLAVYCISSGALFALSARFRRIFAIGNSVPTLMMAVLLTVLLSYAITRWQSLRPIGLLALPPLMVITVLARDGSVFASSRISRTIEQIGLVSYSLYLWQAIATWDIDKYSSTEFYWLSFLALPFAWISFRYVEKPFVGYGRRWSTSVKSLRPGKVSPRETGAA